MSERIRELRGRPDPAAAVDALADREVNYDPGEVAEPDWTFDVHRSPVGRERPGPPEPGGVWETAWSLVHDYAFTPPEIIRAVYRRSAPLLGRDMVLEGRFPLLRFYLGVRVCEVIDDLHGDRRARGWSYRTLEHHLERGQVTYEVVKNQSEGSVEFVASCVSQRAAVGPVLRLGWAVFGRRTQLRFYRRCAQRVRELTQATVSPSTVTLSTATPSMMTANGGEADVVFVPPTAGPAPLDRLAIHLRDPVRRRQAR